MESNATREFADVGQIRLGTQLEEPCGRPLVTTANTKITRANVGTDDIGKPYGSATSMRGERGTETIYLSLPRVPPSYS